MNTAKVACYLPVFHDMVHRLSTMPSRNLLGMMENQLRAEELMATGHRHSIALRDLDNPVQIFDLVGVPTDDHLNDFVPARVFAWAEQQLPAAVADEVRWRSPQTGWEARLQSAPLAVAGQPGQVVPAAGAEVYISRHGSTAEVAVLMRGLRAYQAKRRKQARRLLAQLRALHCQQRRAVAAGVGKGVASA